MNTIKDFINTINYKEIIHQWNINGFDLVMWEDIKGDIRTADTSTGDWKEVLECGSYNNPRYKYVNVLN